MPYVFGVDGGASNSRAVLMTDRGRVVHYAKGPGVNYHEVGASQVTSTISRLFHESLQSARGRAEECKGICLGLAGAGQEQDHANLRPLFDSIFGGHKYMLMTDAEIALVSGTLSETGIIVIAGTGSMIFARNEERKEARVGGYGPLVSDDGSGYRIGLDALRAVIEVHDGIGKKTSLSKLVLEHFHCPSVNDLIHWVNSMAATREKIASVAPLAIQAADEGDLVADTIMNRHANRLALGVEAIHKKLEFLDRVDVVLSGGLLSETSFYSLLVKRKIHYLLPGANVIQPKMEPVLGATLYALSMAEIPIDEDILRTMRQSFKEALNKASLSTPPADRPQDSPQPIDDPAETR